MTINITPENFGNVAAEGMRYGFDVSAYIIRRALRQLPSSTATATRQPAVEEPADICPPRVPLPVPAAQTEKWKPAPPSLTRPGDILEAPEDIDWDDPALYV